MLLAHIISVRVVSLGLLVWGCYLAMVKGSEAPLVTWSLTEGVLILEDGIASSITERAGEIQKHFQIPSILPGGARHVLKCIENSVVRDSL